MKQRIVKTGIFFTAICVAGITQGGELGIGFGSAFNYKASFKSDQVVMPFANDPGAATAGGDHFYDDGYNRIDSSGNFGNVTTFWGYQNDSQYDASGTGTITLNSDRTLVDASNISAEQEGGLGTLEVFWQQDFTSNKVFNYGIRLAGFWQHVRVSNGSGSTTTIETTSDAYELNGVVPASAPFSGSRDGPNALLGDIPMRTFSTAAGSSIITSREIDGHMLGFDVGPTCSMAMGDRLELVASAGGTVAHIHSTFSYDAGVGGTGSSTGKDLLLGAYVGVDLQCRIGEKWGVYGGGSYNYLEGFSQTSGSWAAKLSFEDSCTFSFGIYTEL